MDRDNIGIIGVVAILLLLLFVFFGGGDGSVSCTSDEECGEGEVCGSDGTCGFFGGPGAPCADNEDCEEGLLCIDGFCRVPEVDPCEGVLCVLPQVCYEGDCVDEACVGVECPGDTVCDDGVCVDEACVGVFCLIGEVCVDGECVGEACVGIICPLGAVCVDGECVDEDCVGVECPEGDVCVDGECTSDCDCEPDEICVSAGPGIYTCIPMLIIAECTTNEDCPIGYLCIDGECQLIDLTLGCSPPCEAYESCLNGICVPMSLIPLQTPCEDCPDPKSISTMMFLGYDPEGKTASITISAQTMQDGRQPVKDATIFVKVFYEPEVYDLCRMKTSETGEAFFNYSTGPYAVCETNGCTIRFTFCCANISTGCMIPLCLDDPGITAYNDGIPTCPEYDDIDWPLQATVQDEFIPLYPSLDEITIPRPPDLGVMSFSFAFCLPILVIFGLLSAAMFASGRNPFAALSFYTPRFKKATSYMMRARGLTWNIQGIVNKLTYGMQGAAGAKGARAAKKKAKADKKAKAKAKAEGRVHLTHEISKKGKQTTSDTKSGKRMAQLDSKSNVFKGGDALGAVIETGSVGQKLAAGLGMASLLVSTVFLKKLGVTLAPLAYATNPLLEGLGGVMLEKGADGLADRAEKMREEMGIDIKESTATITVSLNVNGDPDDRITMTFDKTPEGEKAMAEFMGKHMGDIEITAATATKLVAEVSRQNATEVAEKMTKKHLKNASADAQSLEVVAAYARKDGKLSEREYKRGALTEAAKADGLDRDAAKNRTVAERLGEAAKRETETAGDLRNRAEGASNAAKKQEYTKTAEAYEANAAKYKADQEKLIVEAEQFETQADQHYSNIGDLALAADSTGGNVSSYYGKHIAEQAQSGNLTTEEYKTAGLVLAKAAEDGAFKPPTAGEMKKFQEEAAKLQELGVQLEQPGGEMNYGTQLLGVAVINYQSDKLSTLGGVSGTVGNNVQAGTDIAIGSSAAAAAGEQLGALLKNERGEVVLSGRTLNQNSLVSLGNMSEHGEYALIPETTGKLPPAANSYSDAMAGYGSIDGSNNPNQFLTANKKADMAQQVIMDRIEVNAMVGADPGAAEQHAFNMGWVDNAKLNKMRAEGPAALYNESMNGATQQQRDVARAEFSQLCREARLEDRGLTPEDYHKFSDGAVAKATWEAYQKAPERYIANESEAELQAGANIKKQEGISTSDFNAIQGYEAAQIDQKLDQGAFTDLYGQYTDTNRVHNKLMGLADKETAQKYDSIPITTEGYSKDVGQRRRDTFANNEAANKEAEKAQYDTRVKRMTGAKLANAWQNSDDYQKYQDYKAETAAQKQEVAAFDKDYAKAEQDMRMEGAHKAQDMGKKAYEAQQKTQYKTELAAGRAKIDAEMAKPSAGVGLQKAAKYIKGRHKLKEELDAKYDAQKWYSKEQEAAALATSPTLQDYLKTKKAVGGEQKWGADTAAQRARLSTTRDMLDDQALVRQRKKQFASDKPLREEAARIRKEMNKPKKPPRKPRGRGPNP